ncbi:MAG: hypothetical protein NZ572_08160, partial [Thermoflexus sp.]|nr:hypothetical protein [Thermoflexus sp.]
MKKEVKEVFVSLAALVGGLGIAILGHAQMLAWPAVVPQAILAQGIAWGLSGQHRVLAGIFVATGLVLTVAAKGVIPAALT